MNGGKEIEGLWLEENLQSAALWQQAELMADAPPRPAKGYFIVPATWLRQVLRSVRGPRQLAVAMALYRRCLMQRSRTVDLPNGDLRDLGISRQTKYGTLKEFAVAGGLTMETRNGRPIRVTFHWFP